MPNVQSTAALPQHVQQLLTDREGHVQAIAVIDATLGRVGAALAGTAVVKSIPKAAPMTKAAAPAMRKRGRQSKFGTTANEFVLQFVAGKKNATTQEINSAWKEAGRTGTADNTLSLLSKAKKIKRTPLGEGIRGSRYSTN